MRTSFLQLLISLMTLRSPLTRVLFSIAGVACLALVISGCDNSGSSDPSEPTAFTVTIENVGSAAPLLKSGAFTPADESSGNNNPPLTPGEAFQFSFTAGPNEVPGSGMALSFATMFVQSNDLYYAFEPGGLSLFKDDGTPVGKSGPANVTDQVRLYDAGTEVDQMPGTGENQAPRQESLDQGPDENGSVVRVEDTDGDGRLDDSGFEYPPVASGIEVTVQSTEDEASGGFEFTVTVENVSDETGTTVNGAPLVLSPGSFAVHFDRTPGGDDVTLPGHMPGSSASEGIERIAEDGRPGGAPDVPGSHVAELDELTGTTVPLSPGAYAVHSRQATFYETGAAASSGIERIAEDGMPMDMVSMLTGTSGIKSVGVFNTPEGAGSPGPLTPGNSYAFSVEAVPGDRLSLATMYIQSNDLFYAFEPSGLALFGENGQPVSGDVTDRVMLYDAGTEGDQEPGVGLDQAPRQMDTDTGPSGEERIVEVNGEDDGFRYPDPNDIVRVTITPPSQ
jgi:hypothetical protein